MNTVPVVNLKQFTEGNAQANPSRQDGNVEPVRE